MSEAMITRRGGGGGAANLQAKTAIPAASASTVTPDSGYDGLSSVTVAAITPQKEATSYTPGTADQTIAANQWLAGAQTIQGDANLLAANIKKGVSIFNVAGSYEAAALDTNSAILKVVTSTGCSVSVTNGTDTFTQQDADGFVRPNDANVTEHFFVIPTAAFGTFSVTSTHPTYGGNTKTNAVVIGNAGKVYEVLCGGINIILDGTFGLQEGFLNKLNLTYGEYSERYKKLQGTSLEIGLSGNISDIPVGPYSTLKITASRYEANQTSTISLEDQDSEELCEFDFYRQGSTPVSDTITNKYYATAILRFYSPGFKEVTEIVLT